MPAVERLEVSAENITVPTTRTGFEPSVACTSRALKSTLRARHIARKSFRAVTETSVS